MRSSLFFLSTMLLASPAVGEELLRIATVAPDGTGYARTIQAMRRDVEEQTHGEVRMKLYFGGVAGDDVSAAARIGRGQLDGIIASTLCEHLAPSMRVLHVQGLYRNREEWSYVVNKLHTTFQEEMKRSGFVLLGEAALGSTVILSRTPVRSMTDLRRLNLWAWDTDSVKRMMLPAMGMSPVFLSLGEAGRAYELHQTDGFLSVPSAMLAFQWSAHGGYIENLPIDHLAVCVIVAERAFDAISMQNRLIIAGALTKGTLNFENLTRHDDEQLLGELFKRQGLEVIPVDDRFQNDFVEAARQARERLGDKLIPHALMDRVSRILAEYRATRH